MPPPSPLIVPAVSKHTATVIMSHGLGDSGAGWVSLAENWRRRQKFDEVKFIFPSAPPISISINMGMQMPGWYDIVKPRDGRAFASFDELVAGQDLAGILRSREYFHSLIQSEIDAGIPSNRIVLGGFSQGGSISIISGITAPTQIGGIFGLSCYLLLHTKFQDFVPKDNPNKDTPIFIGHGDRDQMIKPEWVQISATALKSGGRKVTVKTYQGLEHSVNAQEIDDVEAYLNERIPPLGDKPTL